MSQAPFQYQGQELDLFKEAENWKRYWTSQVAPYIGAQVLEVGAGLGSNLDYLMGPGVERWLCLEPDPQLAAAIRDRKRAGDLPEACDVQVGVLQDLPSEARFDTILYADVLEHIEADTAEVAAAMARIARGGRLIVLSPAHNWLFSEFDEAVGHFRRYTASGLTALTPADCRLEAIRYLDTVGLLASSANRLLLRQGQPTAKQIGVWDRLMVPMSRWLDPVGRYRLGKTILAIWRKNES